LNFIFFTVETDGESQTLFFFVVKEFHARVGSSSRLTTTVFKNHDLPISDCSFSQQQQPNNGEISKTKAEKKSKNARRTFLTLVFLFVPFTFLFFFPS
jgi:hypothetical protein